MAPLAQMGYATRALQLLAAYYTGQLTNLAEVDRAMATAAAASAAASDESESYASNSVVSPPRGFFL